MKRIAIVVQRYGAEVNGGAELHARLLALALKQYYVVDLLTSRALDYRRWDRHYPAGESQLDGCRVLRFDHPPRDRSRRKHMPLGHKLRFKLRGAVSWLGWPLVAPATGDPVVDGERYLVAQGPTMPDLQTYLAAHADDYAAVIFVTALYHPTALGVLTAAHRAVLVPTLHDEKGMYLPHYHRVFRAPRWVMYNTAAEQALACRLYGVDTAPGEVAGVGIGALPGAATSAATKAMEPAGSALPAGDAWSALAVQHGLQPQDFLLYVGRVDPSKGCAELFEMFARLHARTADGAPLKLVVCGQLFMKAPTHPDIVLAGFVSDTQRDALTAQALALVVPSRYESLSLVLLESMAAGCPVIVNGHCEVLAQHVADSGTGRAYTATNGFGQAVQHLLDETPAQRAGAAERGRRYVEGRYSWSRIIGRYRTVIEQIDTQTPPELGPAPAP